MDIQCPKLLYLKGMLFVLLGLLSAAIILIEHPSLRVGFLLAVTVWAFCRAYYFAFYVVQHYVDPEHRFAGLWAFLMYALHRKKSKSKSAE